MTSVAMSNADASIVNAVALGNSLPREHSTGLACQSSVPRDIQKRLRADVPVFGHAMNPSIIQ